MAAEQDDKATQLIAMVREIQEKVRARHPSGAQAVPGVELPDLLPLLHARDAAQAKVAAIGTVNPRRAGLLNDLFQAVKRLVARALDWHIREQVEFNRAAVNCVQATLDSLNELNRSLVALAGQQAARMEALREEMRESFARIEPVLLELRDEARQLKDIRLHWQQWRPEWERKLSINEVQFLRSVADLQGAFQHRSTLMESNFRGLVEAQHREFEGALARATLDVQKQVWADLERVRNEFERLIHNELRVVRQRLAASPAPAAPAAGSVAQPQPESLYDALRFADRFRGTEQYIKENLSHYVKYFSGRREVVDIGCGRGEFLECMRENGVPARGVDISRECVQICGSKGLDAAEADLFEWLESQPGATLDSIFCAQVVEHLPPDQLPRFIRLAAEKLDRGGLIVIETPNPGCLAIFATHFYLDPTHSRPVPAQLLAFYLEEAGFGKIEARYLTPAADSMPSLNSLPEEFRQAFFGGLDYAIAATRL